MTRTKRERLNGARRAVMLARGAWRKHRQGCRNCVDFSPTKMQHCTEGWDLWAGVRAAEKYRDGLEPGRPTIMPTLF